MKIFSIHGYKGSAHNALFGALIENGFEVCSLQIDYDGSSPKEILHYLIGEYQKNNCDAVAGTSLGGFYAAQICVLNGCRGLFINPCLTPFTVLPGLGYSNKEGIMEFSRMFDNITRIDKNKVSVVVGTDDEIILNHDFTKIMFENERYFEIKGGRHSGATLPLKEIIGRYGTEIFG